MNSGVPALCPAHPPPPAWAPAGWEARPGLPRPQAHPQPLRGRSRPPRAPSPALPSPPTTTARPGKGRSGGSWLEAGAMPLCPTRLAWAGGLPASKAAAALLGAGRGTGREGKARRAWTGRPQPKLQQKGHGRPSPPEDVGAHFSWSTWAIGLLSPVLSFLLRKMGGKSILPAGEMNAYELMMSRGAQHTEVQRGCWDQGPSSGVLAGWCTLSSPPRTKRQGIQQNWDAYIPSPAKQLHSPLRLWGGGLSLVWGLPRRLPSRSLG